VATGPHQSIITIQAKIMDRLPDGRVSGISRQSKSEIFTFTGKNFTDCANQTDSFLQAIEEVYLEPTQEKSNKIKKPLEKELKDGKF